MLSAPALICLIGPSPPPWFAAARATPRPSWLPATVIAATPMNWRRGRSVSLDMGHLPRSQGATGASEARAGRHGSRRVAQLPEALAQVFHQEIRLLPCREVRTNVVTAVIDHVRICLLRPGLGCRVDLVL